MNGINEQVRILVENAKKRIDAYMLANGYDEYDIYYDEVEYKAEVYLSAMEQDDVRLISSHMDSLKFELELIISDCQK